MLKHFLENKLILFKLLISILLFFFGWLILKLSKNSAQFATTVWRPIATKVTGALSNFFSFTSYSCVEIFLYAFILFVLISLIYTLIKIIKDGGKIRRAFSFISSLLLISSFLYLMFECLYGYNYYAFSKTQGMNLEVKERPVSELFVLCKTLALQANELSSSFSYDICTPDPSDFKKMASDVTDIVNKYTNTIQSPPKRILLSNLMCYTGLTGVFAPFTGEANINASDISIPMPFTMAHELMHRWGVNPEDEANLFAFIALYECDNNCYRYSACYMGLLYTLPKLRKADHNLYDEVRSLLSDRVKVDINIYNTHWSQYEGKTSEVTNKVNNSFLELHGETDGVQSYGNVVDWLLAYFDHCR